MGNKPILLCCLWLCEVGPWENSFETTSWVFDSSGEFEEITMRWSLSEFRLTFTEKCAFSNVMLGAIFQFFSYASLPPPQARVGKDTCFMPDVMTSGSPVRWRLTFCVNWKKIHSRWRPQLLFAFSTNYTNHFKFFTQKLENTFSSVMSHVSPANFQALDQQVSNDFFLAKDWLVSTSDKGTWQRAHSGALCFGEFRHREGKKLVVWVVFSLLLTSSLFFLLSSLVWTWTRAR